MENKPINNENVTNMITDITKKFRRCDIFDLSAHILNYYYTYFYQGSEHDTVSLMYFDYVNIELAMWLGRNAQYLKQDDKSVKKLKQFFKKEIIKAKIESHSTRVEIYHKWLGKKFDDPNSALQVLFKLYPKTSQYKDVKKDLGLNETVIDLRKKLKELKKEKK